MEKQSEYFRKKTKVLAYIISELSSELHLLIFAHKDYPDAGLQVPGGTIEEGEDLQIGMLREVEEESGLIEFDSINYIGELSTGQKLF